MGTITAGAYDIAVTSLRLVDIDARRAHMKLHANGSITEFACHSAACRPPASGGTGGSLPGAGDGTAALTRVGQRVDKKTNTAGHTTLHLDEISEGTQKAMVARLHEVGAIPKSAKTPEQTVAFIRANVEHVFGLCTPEEVAAWRPWYVVAHNIAGEIAGPRHDGVMLSAQAVAGGMAVFSPKTEWNINLATTREGFRILRANPALTAEQAHYGNGLSAKKFASSRSAWERSQTKAATELKLLETEHDYHASVLSKKALSTLNGQIAAKKEILATPMPKAGDFPHFKEGERPSDHSSMGAGYFLRIITPNPLVRDVKVHADSTYDDSEFVMTQGTKRKDGTYSVPPRPIKGSWQGYGNLEKFVNIYRGDGSLENISANLGFEHKVRSFFNNINDPHNTAGDVTIDTHAFGVGLGVPVSMQHPWIKSGVKNITGTPKMIEDGTSGAYALFHEAYRQAAEAHGLRPLEMQSVTWMKWRELNPKAARAKATRKKTTKGMAEHKPVKKKVVVKHE